MPLSLERFGPVSTRHSLLSKPFQGSTPNFTLLCHIFELKPATLVPWRPSHVNQPGPMSVSTI